MWCLHYLGEERPQSCYANLRYFLIAIASCSLTSFSHYETAVSGDLDCLIEFSMDHYLAH